MLPGIRKWAQRIFGFSQTEANGFILLIAIMLLSSLIPFGVRWFAFRDPLVSAEEQQRLDSLLSVIQSSIDTSGLSVNNSEVARQLFYFDPNHVTKEELLLLGLTEEVANRWIKYRVSGGSFLEVSDIRRIYGLTAGEFRKLKPYAVLSEVNRNREVQVAHQALPEDTGAMAVDIPVRPAVIFDVNTVDSSELIQVRGIGRVLSGRIIKFRSSLGGFISLDQLDEVYGIEEYALENLKESFAVSADFVPNQIDINHADIEDLARHPYISFEYARVIVAFRKQHGPFRPVDGLYQIQIIDSTWMKRITPYLIATPRLK